MNKKKRRKDSDWFSIDINANASKAIQNGWIYKVKASTIVQYEYSQMLWKLKSEEEWDSLN